MQVSCHLGSDPRMQDQAVSEVGGKLGEYVWKRKNEEVLLPVVGFLLLSFGFFSGVYVFIFAAM